MFKSDTIGALAAALAKAQGEFAAVPFNTTNKFLGNRYADLGAVIEAAKPIIAKHGLSLAQLTEDGGEGAIGVTTLLMHSSGEWLSAHVSLPLGEEKGKSRAQVAGSIVSYLRRYAYASILGLYAEEETDGNDNPNRTVENRRDREPLAKETTADPRHHTPQRGKPAAMPTDAEAAVGWLREAFARMESPNWSEEQHTKQAQNLAAVLKGKGITEPERLDLYEALTGKRSGKQMEPAQLIVINQHADQVGAYKVIAAWHRQTTQAEG